MPKTIQTRKRLGELYGVDRETISRWLKRMGITHSGCLTPQELELFVNEVGVPGQLKQMAERLLPDK